MPLDRPRVHARPVDMSILTGSWWRSASSCQKTPMPAKWSMR